MGIVLGTKKEAQDVGQEKGEIKNCTCWFANKAKQKGLNPGSPVK